jgi:hypothetical protein
VITESWQDLVSKQELEVGQKSLILKPYQTVWLTNKFHNE